MNKEEIIMELERLNKTHMVKINNTDKERRVFNDDDTFKIFGNYKSNCLDPSDDYSYEWLNSFLYNVIDLIKHEEFDDFDELSKSINEAIPEWADSETDIYTSDLTEWLNDRCYNVSYIEEVQKEYGVCNEGDKLLAMAQYKAIEELFTNATNILIEYLKDNYE